MEKYFKLDHFNLKIKKNILLSSFSFSLNQSLCILGKSGAGKTCFLKKLSSRSFFYQTNGVVSFYFTEIEEILDWREVVHYSSLDKDEQKFCDFLFQHETYLSYKCGLFLKILENPDYLFSDYLPFSSFEFRELLSFLEKKNILFCYVTSDIEQVVWFSSLIVLHEGKVALEGKTSLVLKEEKIMKLLGFSLPFFVNLSIQLGYYGLISDIYYTKEDLEGALWQSK